MQMSSQAPDPVEIIEHGVAKTRRIRPQIGGPKGSAGKQFWIIGSKFEADIESLFDVSRFARIESLAAEPYVAAVTAGAAERGCLADRRRPGEESGGAIENASPRRRRGSMPRNGEETDPPACSAPSPYNNLPPLRRAAPHTAHGYHSNS